MTPSRVQPSWLFLPLGSLGAFEGRSGADDACGEAWLDTLFERTQAIDHASDVEHVRPR